MKRSAISIRAREAASQDLRRKRQQLLSFLLRHGRIFSGASIHWSRAHLRWLAQQQFDHPAQQIVFQDAVDAIDDAATRLRRLDEQVAAIVPSWSMAPVVEAYQAMRGVSFVVEGAWSYRYPARVSQTLQARLEGLPKAVRAIAWTAQIRLCARYCRLTAAGKKLPVIIAAIAREMAAFLWAIARHVAPAA
jgi:transposase